MSERPQRLVRGRVLNVTRSRHDARDMVAAFPRAEQVTAFPESARLDQRLFSPIWDQGAEGSCTAHGGGAAWVAAFAKQFSKQLMPSRQFIYWCERFLEGDVNADNGAQIRDCVKAMARFGVPTEDQWPYESAFAEKPSAAAFADGLTRRVRSYASVPSTPEAIIAQLLAQRAVIFGFDVFPSFESVDHTGVVPMPARGERAEGGHCVAAIGYEITSRGGLHHGVFGPLLDLIFGTNRAIDGRFLVRNSWGLSWGMSGYCWMPFNYFRNGIAWDAWVITDVADHALAHQTDEAA